MGSLRVFLDANVLFSMAYSGKQHSRAYILVDLAKAKKINLYVSSYVVEEAQRNLEIKRPKALEELSEILQACHFLPDYFESQHQALESLPEGDRPILATAIENKMTHLLTGNIRDFKKLLGKKIAEVWILTPKDFLHRQNVK